MKKIPDNTDAAAPSTDSGQALRRLAEELLREKQSGQQSEAGGKRPAEDAARLVHELQVHQIELEMQNEQLQQARAKADALLAQYTDLYDFAPTGYLTLDCEGAIRQVNLTGALLLGVERSRLVNRRFGQFVAEGDRRAFSDFLEKVFASEAKACCEVTLPKEGSQPLVVVIEGRRTEDGQECRASVLDITERKQMEKSLRDSEEKFRRLVEGLKTEYFFYRHDTNGVFTYVSPSIAIVLGHSPEEFCVHFETFLTDSPANRNSSQNTAQSIQGIQQAPFEVEIRHRNGSIHLLHVLESPVFDADGKVVAVEGIAHDITGRKQAEKSLRESEEKFSIAFKTSAYAITITRAKDGKIIDVNDAFMTMSGFTREEAHADSSIGLKLWMNIEDRDRVVNDLRAGRTVVSREYQFRAKGDKAFPGSFSARVILLGGEHCILSSIEDITERVHAAEEKAKLEDQLRQLQKLEAIGRLAGGVAHDFNNMTAIVLGYGELLLGQLPLEAPARKSVEQILGAGRRSAALTRQLLAFSRKQTLQPMVLDLNALLRNFENLLGRLIGEDIELEVRLSADSAHIMADPGQLEQVVMNLVLNARDAMPQGGKLTVETAAVELDHTYAQGHVCVVPGRYVMLALTDSGVGMDQATMTRIFEPFFTTKDIGKGTGLGLATVYGIVKQSGGYIWAYSEPGMGTSFKIYLPRTDAEPVMRAVEAREEPPRGQGERILLVEDEASLLELNATILSSLGYRVSSAGSGPEALLLAEEKGFEADLVVTDVVMPGMSGPEMLNQLLEDRPGLKVLYMSGFPDEALAHHGVLDPGLSLQKPFTKRALAVEVRRALGGMAEVLCPSRRVLMIDDDEPYRELVQHFCEKRGHVFVGVNDTMAALAALVKQPFDVLLVDLNIPGTSGERVLREIRGVGHVEPAIVLTGNVTLADLNVLRPLGVVSVLEKSSQAEPLLQAISEALA